MRASIVLMFLATLVLFSGCATERPTRGAVYQPTPGNHFLDFFFEDEHGHSVSLGNSLGDFTILAFTQCDGDTHIKPSRFLESIVAEYRKDKAVSVKGVDIHWSENENATHQKCHLLHATSDTLSICDATGMIHRLYGATKPNELFLIGPDRRVIGKATVAYTDRLEHQLAIDVARFRGRLYETRPEELGE